MRPAGNTPYHPDGLKPPINEGLIYDSTAEDGTLPFSTSAAGNTPNEDASMDSDNAVPTSVRTDHRNVIVLLFSGQHQCAVIENNQLLIVIKREKKHVKDG